MISLREVESLARKGNVIPVTARISSDLETPVSAFMKLTHGKPYSFLLESIEGGEKLARYSFVGFDPFLLIKGTGRGITLQKGNKTRELEANPAEFLEAIFDEYRPVPVEGLPRFTGGAVGYFSYDCIRWFERVPQRHQNEIGLPDLMFGLYKSIVAFDHLKQEMVIISNLLLDGSKASIKRRYQNAVREIDGIIAKLNKPLPRKRSSPGVVNREWFRRMTKGNMNQPFGGPRNTSKKGTFFKLSSRAAGISSRIVRLWKYTGD